MTVAVRHEPTFHAVGQSDDGQREAAAAQVPPTHAPAHAAYPVRPASGFTRFISGFQAISTLIGVPLALASGYSLYRTNFAPDATCGNLRASIVSMLDKNVDPATRRMLVKRDIEAFEASCGTVDPDAHAAFKSLLAVAAVPAAKAVATPKPVQAAQPPAPVARDVAKDTSKDPIKDLIKDQTKDLAKAELRPAILEKKSGVVPQAVTQPAAAQPEPSASEAANVDTGMSDTRWLDAVRQALVEPTADAKEPGAEPVQASLKSEPSKIDPAKADPAKTEPVKAEHRKAEPVVSNKPGEPVLQPSWQVTPPSAAAPSAAAPADASPLPPAVEVAMPPAPANGNHPVPPGAVPAAQYANNNGSWIAQIPFVGRMIERHGN